MRAIYVIFLITMTLLARENPFFPTSEGLDLPISSNEDASLAKLTKESIKLDSSSRVIKKVTIEYQRLDGSMATKSLDINKQIDWHKPIYISQEIDEQKPKTLEQKTIIEPKKQEQPPQISSENFLTVTSLPQKISLMDKKILLYSSDELERSFVMSEPCRVVLDFKSTNRVKNQNIKLDKSIFTQLKVGFHDGYYRLVFELDGKYKHKLTKKETGYEIEFF